MVGIYFSGTGNSRYAVEVFTREYQRGIETYSIEDAEVNTAIKQHETIIFSYPVQYSAIPKIVQDFVGNNSSLWKGKKVFIIATMGLFSGDGAGMLGRLLQKYGAIPLGGLHLKMPDSIADEKALKRPLEKNIQLIKEAENKMKHSVEAMKNGKPTQEGMGIFYHIAGLFGQRLYFLNKTRQYTDKLKIDADKCISCGKCVKLCPMHNIEIQDGKVSSHNQCTMCYRCINQCPKQAITLLGKQIVEQGTIEKYLK